MITMICWMEGDIEGGLSHYHRYLESKGDDNKLLKTIGDAKPFFDNNIWFFLLRLSNEQNFINWLDGQVQLASANLAKSLKNSFFGVEKPSFFLGLKFSFFATLRT